MNPVAGALLVNAVVDVTKFAASAMANAVQTLYGAAKGLDAFLDKHIEALKNSPDDSINRIGRVLEGAKRGLALGYAVPVILLATGHLLLGNPLSVATTVLTAATLTNPVASTCAALGAIYFGWKALNKSEQQAVIESLRAGFEMASEIIREVIEFGLELLKSSLGRKEIEKIKERVAEFAGKLGRSIYSVTGKMLDLVYTRTDVTSDVLASRPLRVVLSSMGEEELRGLLVESVKVDRNKLKDLSRADLESLFEFELRAAASYSLPGATQPVYDDIVRIVARRLRLPHRATIPTEDVERAILFKVLERSLDRLSVEQREQLAVQIQRGLRDRGVDRKVTFDEVVRFVKFAGVDVGGTLGTLALAAPGAMGVIGLNVLQMVVLQGIIATSGYVAGLGAVLGFGMGGAMIAVAGAAGPIQ